MVKKKGKKKKLSKKELEALRLAEAEEALRQIEEERLRLDEEKLLAYENEKREIFEHSLRIEQLEYTNSLITDLFQFNQDLNEKFKENRQWNLYVNCDHLPNPTRCDQLSTYLHRWNLIINQTTIDGATKRTTDILYILNEIDDLIDEKIPNFHNLIWIRLLIRQYQAKSLDVATYHLLRNIEKQLNRQNITTSNYTYLDANCAIYLWLRVTLPTALTNPRKPTKPRIDVAFDGTGMHVIYPESITCHKMALRAMYLIYDHLSDLSDNYLEKKQPELFKKTLLEQSHIEWSKKLLYKYDNRDVNVDKVIGNTVYNIPIVTYRKLSPTPNDYVVSIDNENFEKMREEFEIKMADNIVNLRKFMVIGGVFILDLLKQPPQPQQYYTMDMELTRLTLPKILEHEPFLVHYNVPERKSSELNKQPTPEEIEEEMKAKEAILDCMINVNLTWPKHVIFLELPIICRWNSDLCEWTTGDIYDVKHNEEKMLITFRTTCFGTFALATLRYVNLPYQAWDLRPESNGSITLQITAAILILEFNVKDNMTALTSLQNAPNNALDDKLGKYYPLKKLIRLMQMAGIDVFPSLDAFLYIENACEKYYPMESHLYINMAQCACAFNMSWSRWNMTVGRRSIVLQIRHYNPTNVKQHDYMMLNITPNRAIYVNCTEISQLFIDTPTNDMKFYADLFNLIKSTNNINIRTKLHKQSKSMINQLSELLIKTRVLSFS